MEQVLDAPVALAPVRDALTRSFARTFSREVTAVSESELLAAVD